MKKRFISMLLILSITLSLFQILGVNIAASSTLSISQPSTDFISKENFTYIKWNSVSGAAGYRITIVDGTTGELYTSERNLWVGNVTQYSISSILDNISGYPMLKIWVGAMASSGFYTESDVISSEIVWTTVAEAPEITNDGDSNITSDSVTLEMTVVKNYGSAIEDAGFYIGTSSKISSADKYSFTDHGPSDIVNNGTMTMNITGLNAETRYYYWAYAVNGVDETTSSRSYFWTEEETGSLSVSNNSINLNWGTGNEASVSVTYSGSYSYDIEYDVSSAVENSGYDYEWLNCEKSGSTLRFTPKRANYSASPRIAYVTVTSGSETETITVTQAKCGESAPTITLTRGSTVYSDGDDIGTFTLPQENMEIWVTSSNVRKLTAHLGSTSEGTIQTCTNTEHISFDISGLSAGDYTITVYASNSSISNDYWSQSPFENKKMTLYFSLRGDSSELEQSFNNIAAPNILDEHETYVFNAIKYHLEDSDIINALDKDQSIVLFFDGCSINLENATICASGYEKIDTYLSSTKRRYNTSAVCIVVKNNGGNPVIEYATKYAVTMADNVRSTAYDTDGAAIIQDGKYSIVTFNHKGYAGFQIRDLDTYSTGAKNSIIRSNGSLTQFSTDTTSGTGIDIHAHKNKWCTSTSADSAGCLLVGKTISISNSEYTNFVRTTSNTTTLTPITSTGGTSYSLQTYPADGVEQYSHAGYVIIDRSCHLMNLTTIYGDDTVSGGLSDDEIASGEDIAREITRISIEWRRDILGNTDQIVQTWDDYDTTSIHTKPGAGGIVVTNYNITGTVTSYGDADEAVTVILYNADGIKIDSDTPTDGTYTLSAPDGTYTLEVSKLNHVTREYEVTVDGGEVTQDVKICLLGDVDLNGKVNTRDWNALRDHLNKSSLITDTYALKCADTYPSNTINTRDWNALRDHLNKSKPLW